MTEFLLEILKQRCTGCDAFRFGPALAFRPIQTGLSLALDSMHHVTHGALMFVLHARL